MIRYSFVLGPGKDIRFDIEEDSDTSVESADADYPVWLELSRHRCKVCSIPPDSRRTCPAMLAIKPAIDVFSGTISFESISAAVEIQDVRTETSMPAQKVVRSLMGLQLALSSCPVMRMLRPMAHIHMPFGNRDHTTFRFLGMYLIAQHLRRLEGCKPDWNLEGLHQLFERIHSVNQSISNRIRDACQEDATVNSLVLLDTFAYRVEATIDDSAERLKPLFSMYLDEEG